MKKTYNVVWQIEVFADSPEEAAIEAMSSISHGSARVFTVQDSNTPNDIFEVDLDCCDGEEPLVAEPLNLDNFRCVILR